MILILTNANDPTTDDLITLFNEQGARMVRFETADFPQKARLSVRKGNEGSFDCLELNGTQIDLSEVRTVWNRRPKPPKISESMDPEDREFAQKETDLIYRGVLYSLRDRFWVNPLINSQVGEYKPYQLQVAQMVGFEIPQTLITNHPDEVRGFYQRLGGNIIYKPVSGHCRNGDVKAGIKPQGIYTNRVKEQDLDRLESVTLAPCLFQDYVSKKVELRVTVVGRKVFAAEIHSQQSERSKEDWRRYDLDNTPYYEHKLPAEIEARCLRLVQEMGLVFGCIDLILTPDDRYVFLEINPNGQWGWIEELTGMPIAANLTKMLVQGTPNYSDSVQTSQP